MNNDGLVHFANDEPLPKKMEATYLGNEINHEANIKHEIFNKMQEVKQTWFKLLPYWKATNANVKWQLLLFDAVVRSKLLYGLETIQTDRGHAKENWCLPDTVLEKNPQNSVNFHRYVKSQQSSLAEMYRNPLPKSRRPTGIWTF